MNNISDYELLTMMENAFQKAANDAAELVQNYVRVAVYNRKPKSHRYDRLKENGGFISAFDYGVVIDDGDDWTISIYDENNMVQSASDTPNRFNHHMSLHKINGKYKMDGLPGARSYGGKSIAKWLIEWYEYGTQNFLYPEVPALDYINKTFAKYGGIENFLTQMSVKYFVEDCKKRKVG